MLQINQFFGEPPMMILFRIGFPRAAASICRIFRRRLKFLSLKATSAPRRSGCRMPLEAGANRREAVNCIVHLT